MSFEELVKMVPPPLSPVGAGTPDGWREVEFLLGITLPQDYKQFINTYGTVAFYNFFAPVSPFDNGIKVIPDNNLIQWVSEGIETYKMVQEGFPEECHYPTFPEPGGLLPFAGDEHGGTHFWLTSGEPDEWIIVLGRSDFVDFEEHQTSLTGFLVGWLSGEIVPRLFPKNILNRNVPIIR